jgi:hypothetical protein
VTGQPWLAAALAAVMIVTAGYCLTRLGLSWRRGRETDRQVDSMHVLMGVVMAGMLLPHFRLPWPGVWEGVFATAVALLAWRIGASLRRRASGHAPGHDLQHLLACGAMLYMLAAGAAVAAHATSGTGMTVAAGRSSPTLALTLAVALLASVVLAADRLTSLPRVRPEVSSGSAGRLVSAVWPGRLTPAAATTIAAANAAAAPSPRSPEPTPRSPAPLSPRLAACCEIAMGLTMGYMLITML